MLGDLQGPLVGNLEVADLLDIVAPELDAERVLLGGREDVQDAAADGELAALLDQFDAGVRGGREPVDDLAEIGALPRAQADGDQVAEPLDLRLEHGADGRDDDGDGAGGRVVGAGVGEAAQHREAAADGVRAGREPLVRQRLPGGELRDGVLLAGRDEGAQRGGEVLGLPAGGGDREHRPPGVPGERRHREGAGRGRADEVHMRAVAVGPGPHRFGERRILDDGVEQTSKAHERFRPSEANNANSPARRSGRGGPHVERAGVAHLTPDR